MPTRLAALFSLGLSVLAVVGCGGDSTTTVVKEQGPAQTQSTTTVTTTTTDEEDSGDGDTTVVEGGDSTTGGPAAAPGTECSLGVYAGSANTSCEFAEAVADRYYATGASSFETTSPATNETYQVSCEIGASVITCEAGNNARVYLTH